MDVTRFLAHRIRVVTLEGNPWFCKDDVAAVLGLNFESIKHHVRSNLDPSEKRVEKLPGKKGQGALFLSESGLYKITLRVQRSNPAAALNTEKSGIWISKKGRGGGTLLHPKMAVRFAQWLDVRFAVWCDLMIDNILRGNIQTSVVVPTKEAVAVQAVAEKLKLEKLQEEGLGGSKTNHKALTRSALYS